MNCEDFDKIVTELADYQPMLSAARDAGVSHAAWCADCARKLVDTRAVSASLLLAANAETETAPSSVKTNLLAAFAEQEQKRSAGNIVPMPQRRSRRWPIVAGLTAAAAAAILLAVVLPLLRRSHQLELPINAALITPSPNNVGSATTIGMEPPAVAIVRKKRNAIRKMKPAQSASGYQTVVAKSRDEYIPLTYLAKTTAIDTGTIVRVRLSRSALVSLGLPVNLENTSDSVSAEVVMGDDGVARAIRLVQ